MTTNGYTYRDGPDYVNRHILPVTQEGIKPEYVLQVFVGACLNGAAWWLDKAKDTPVVDEQGRQVLPFRELERYIAMIMSVLPYLPVDPNQPNSRVEVIRELSGLLIETDELYDLANDLRDAMEKEADG